jgi:hypothetical protein
MLFFPGCEGAASACLSAEKAVQITLHEQILHIFMHYLHGMG